MRREMMYHRLGLVKWFRFEDNYFNGKIPLAQIPGYPENGPEWFCLKELWADEDGNEEWRNVEVIL